MVYFDFNYVTDPPDDETVNVETQLNANWQELEDKLTPFNQMPADFDGITIPVGTECFDPDPAHSANRIAVWTGAIWARGVSHITPWSGWQSVAIRSPVANRSTLPVLANVNVISRRVMLRGGVTADAVASAWPTGSTVEITTDTAIQPELAPVNGEVCYRQGATGLITAAGGFAGAVVIIERKASPDRVAISVRYQGDAGGGNFVMLDGLSWWY